MATNINEPSEAIQNSYSRWRRNRDMIAGEDAVKRAKSKYLPRLANQTDRDFENYLDRISFFPGAARTHDGLLGLVTRKAGVFECPPNVEDIFEVVTRRGDTIHDLAEEVMSETLKTGFGGLLVDMPVMVEGLTEDVAVAQGYRAFVAYYPAESILEVSTGIVANRQAITRVRLLEDADTVRELLLVDGAYVVIVHRHDGKDWVAEDPMVPLRRGEPLTFIPFVPVTPKARGFEPVKGPLDDICMLNRHLFQAEAEAANSRHYSSAPIFVVSGAEKQDIPLCPGTAIFFADSTREKPVEAKYVEFSGAGQATLEGAVATKKDEMAKLGSSILASERPAAEAAETHAIRRSSENSILASLARTVGRKIEEALDLISWWAGNEQGLVRFALNTDFVPTPMTAQERTALLAELQAGAISYETYVDLMIAGEVLPDGFDIEAERVRLAASADRPGV